MNQYLRIARCLRILLVVFIATSSSCTKIKSADAVVDAVMIGGGIMSATLASMLNELDPSIAIDVYERLDGVALESTAAWNNAGTGHAAFAELNYTPQHKDGSINIAKAIDVSEAFELSKSYWAYLASVGIVKPADFINHVPHISFVWGDDNVEFLKKRHAAMIKHPLFVGMEYSQDHALIKSWAPLLMAGRGAGSTVAATRMQGGVDVNFGALTEAMFANLTRAKNFHLHVRHEVKDIIRNDDKTWTVVVENISTGERKNTRTKFVFIGAGGGALGLLQKSGIKEADGFGGFPVGGAWLISTSEDLIAQHQAKVYGMAPVGSPPMSVPHLDTRFIDGKKALLFGPFATFSTKFLKNGSWSDLPLSVNISNFVPMMQVGVTNFSLVGYLVTQVMLGKEEQVASLRDYFPAARDEDWRFLEAGQRVQIIKRDKDKGGVLQFGTEVVSADDKTLVALLGASPGASTAVKTMIAILESSFAERMRDKAWQEKLVMMIPSYGKKLADNENLVKQVRERNKKLLSLGH